MNTDDTYGQLLTALTNTLMEIVRFGKRVIVWLGLGWLGVPQDSNFQKNNPPPPHFETILIHLPSDMRFGWAGPGPWGPARLGAGAGGIPVKLFAMSARLFVANLAWGISEVQLKDAFAPYGIVEAVVERNDQGLSRGFGFLSFKTSKDATRAMEAMQGHCLAKRELKLEFSKSRSKKRQRNECAQDSPHMKRQHLGTDPGFVSKWATIEEAVESLKEESSCLKAESSQLTKCGQQSLRKKKVRAGFKTILSALAWMNAQTLQDHVSKVIHEVFQETSMLLLQLSTIALTEIEKTKLSANNSPSSVLEVLCSKDGLVRQGRKVLQRISEMKQIHKLLRSETMDMMLNRYQKQWADHLIRFEKLCVGACVPRPSVHSSTVYEVNGREGSGLDRFVFNAKLTEKMKKKRTDFITQLKEILARTFAEGSNNTTNIFGEGVGARLDLREYGSGVSKLATESSDMDLAIVVYTDDSSSTIDRDIQVKTLVKFKQSLTNAGLASTLVKGRIPLLRLHPKQPMSTFDVSDSNASNKISLKQSKAAKCPCSCDITVNGPINNHNFAKSELVSRYVSLDNRVGDLILCVKHWARSRGVGDASKTGINSFSWTLMVIYYLQRTDPPSIPVLKLPDCLCYQCLAATSTNATSGSTSNVKCTMSSPTKSFSAVFKNNLGLKELLAGFFRLYALDFEPTSKFISVHPVQHVTQSLRDPRISTDAIIPTSSSTPRTSLAQAAVTDVHGWLHIVDPFDPFDNPARNTTCALWHRIHLELMRAHIVMSDATFDFTDLCSASAETLTDMQSRKDALAREKGDHNLSGTSDPNEIPLVDRTLAIKHLHYARNLFY